MKDEARLICTYLYSILYIRIGALIRMGALKWNGGAY